MLLESNLVTIGVVSDTHLKSKDVRFNNLVEEFFSHCDLIIHAGDLVSDEIFSDITIPFIAVRGNMDFESKFPLKRELNFNGVSVGVIHGYSSPFGIEKRIKREFENVDCIVYGHTHKAHIEMIDGVLFFNPGSPFRSIWTSKQTVGYLYVENGNIRGEIKEIKFRG